jgi:hypothetical protein
MPAKLTTIDYRDARKWIASGDVLLFRDVPAWRGGHWYSAPFRVATRSRYTHAGMAAWAGGRLLVLQSTAWGSRKPALSALVRRYPGSIDVYRIRPGIQFAANNVAQVMLESVRHSYGWYSLSKVVLCHIAGLRWLVRTDENDDAVSDHKPFCSEAVARAYRLGSRLDLVPNCADAYTTPGDLARSALLRYEFTLGLGERP